MRVVGVHRIVMLLATIPALAAAADSPAPPVDYVSGNVPIAGSHALQHRSGARVPLQSGRTALAAPVRSATAGAFGIWKNIATLPGTSIVHDVAFLSMQVGYAVGEVGLVMKTIDGGKTWTSTMSGAGSYYWYGIQALTEQDLFVSGFFDGLVGSTPMLYAVARWSHDGGATWSDDIIFPSDMLGRAHFFDAANGVLIGDFLVDDTSAGIPAYLTQNGGASAADWNSAIADPNEDWFGNQLSALAGGALQASGIRYCASANFGVNWNCRASIDPVFDGATFFFDAMHGWVGGGSISPTDEGWMHRTTDGGQTWTDRTLDSDWPIREIQFATSSLGWAAGGDTYSGIGGIFRSDDGGQTWTLDVDTGAEMGACAIVSYLAYCIGFDNSFNGQVYAVDWDHVFVDGLEPAATD